MGKDKSDNNDRRNADKKFFELRNSGYKGPIDQDGNKVKDVDAWIKQQMGR
jgi:hypothetical protein